MTLAVGDLHALRRPLAGLLATLMLASIVGWAAYRDAQHAGREQALAAARRQRSQQRLQAAQQDAQQYHQQALQLLAWQQAGIIGPERRLEWVEHLLALQRELQLPSLHYEFAPRVPLAKENLGAPAWFSSPLQLQLRLLHEEDLLRFLHRLQQTAPALILVHGCQLQPAVGDEGKARGLTADCALQWLTIDTAPGTP